MPAILVALTLLLFGGTAANAACTCQCVDGRVEPVCDAGINPPIVCKPTVCRVLKPIVTQPIVAPEACRQARVCDSERNCKLELVCR